MKYQKKLQNIKKKWDQYNKNAESLGLDTDTLCNMTCSDECFTDAETSAQQVTTILTTCLMKQCGCFKPNLPKAGKKGGQDQLIDFTNMVIDSEKDTDSFNQDYTDSSDYKNSYSQEPAGYATNNWGAENSQFFNFDSVVDSTAATAKDLYKKANDKVTEVKDKATKKADEFKSGAADKAKEVSKQADKQAQDTIDSAKAKADEAVDSVK